MPDQLVIDVLGELVTPEEESLFGSQICQWKIESDSQEPFSDNELAFHTGTLSNYETALDINRAEGEPVEGIGTEAFVVPGFSSGMGGGTNGSSLYVVDGDRVFVVSAVLGKESTDTEKLSAIAEALLE